MRGAALRPVLIGMAVGLAVFVAANLLWAHVQSDCGLPALLGQAGCADDIRRAGWPFQFWEEGGFAYRRVFSLPALLADAAVGLAAAAVGGWAARRWWGQWAQPPRG